MTTSITLLLIKIETSWAKTVVKSILENNVIVYVWFIRNMQCKNE